MRLARVVAVARKEALQIRRDPRSLAMGFAIPMLLLFLFGYALSLDVNALTTVVLDQDGSPASRAFLTDFAATGYFPVAEVAARPADVSDALDEGRAQVAVVIPRGFEEDLRQGRRVEVQALLDGTDANTATIAMAYMDAIAARGRPPVEARLRVWYNEEMLGRNYVVPGLIAVIMTVVAALLTSLTVAREWERGTMEQLIATPLAVPEMVAGKLLPYFAIGMADTLLAVAASVWVFGVPFRGSLLLLLALSAVFMLGALGMGLLISIRARSQLVASQIAMVTSFLPSFLLSGFMFDIANMPLPMQALTHVFPARWFVSILKGIFLKGVDLRVLAGEAVFLAAFATLVLAASIRSFRKRLG